MKKKIACLHAHHSNIQYIEEAFFEYEVEWLHFVDPGLMYVVNHQKEKKLFAQRKIRDQLDYISTCDVAAILVTCTQYILLLEEFQFTCSIPIIKIDDPFFEQLSISGEEVNLVFTNSQTMEGTMSRFINNRSMDIPTKAHLIKDAYELLMVGEYEEYKQKILDDLNRISQLHSGQIAVAQLSMTEAAKQAVQQFSISIVDPLQALVDVLITKCQLHKKNSLF